MSDQKTLAYVKGWLPVALNNIKARLKKLRIHDTGELHRSVHGTVQKTSDGFQAIIVHHYYGIFPDMGVGRGQSRDDVAVAKLLGSGRKKKPWTRAIAKERYAFGDVVVKFMADDMVERLDKDKKVVFYM